MNFSVLTLFPDMIRQSAACSILGRAAKNGYITVDAINIRDFSTNKHNRVDDYPYGGGAGMVMEAEPVYRAVMEAKKRTGQNTRVVYLTPQGKVLNQTMVEDLAMEENLILLCGHYEGIDERVLEETVTDYISIGDYVLTGGELGAMVLIDAVSRFVPGVLSNQESSQFESLQDNLLEYPHFTRPEVWHDQAVPEVLLCGDHVKIEKWRREQSVLRTSIRRPDLLKKSYTIRTVYYGDEEVLEYAEKLTNQVSRYGTLYDYARKKLQKTVWAMGEHDAILLIIEENRIHELTESAVFRNLHGKNTPYVLIIIAEKTNEIEYTLPHNKEFDKLYAIQGSRESLEARLAKDALRIRELLDAR